MSLWSSGQVTSESERRTSVCWGQEVLCVCEPMQHLCSHVATKRRCWCLALSLSALFLSDGLSPKLDSTNFRLRCPVLVLKVCAATLGLVCVCYGPNQLLLFEHQVFLPTDPTSQDGHLLKRRVIIQWVRNILLGVQNDKV